MCHNSEMSRLLSPEMVDFVYRTLEEVEDAKKESREPNIDPFLIELAEDVMSSHCQEPVRPTWAIKASPLIEFSPVSIHRNTKELDDMGASSEISVYGHVKLVSDYGKEFFLFKRERDDPETACTSDNLSAIVLKSESYCPHWVPKHFWLQLELYLIDNSRGITIVKDEFLLQFRRKVVYDKEQQVIIYDNTGYWRVTVNYTIFRFAVLALGRFAVFKNKSGRGSAGSDKCDVVLSGTISANTVVRDRKEVSRVLYDKQSMAFTVNDDPTYDYSTWLPAFAVPAYSLLRLKADLVVDGERIVSGDNALEFEPTDLGLVPSTKVIVGEKWGIRVDVFWDHAYGYLDRDELVGELLSYDNYATEDSQEEFSESEKGEGESSMSEENAKGKEISLGEKSSIEELQEESFPQARALVEVFSVSIGSFGHDNHALRVCGTIKCNDLLIFERDEMDPELVYPHKTLSLLKPRCCNEVVDGFFDMHFDLKDTEGREISKGYLEWGSLGMHHWRDRRISSFVPGEQTFACVVHYGIFYSAVAANVSVRILSLNYHPVVYKVYGRIHARYKYYRYSTHYERKYYLNMLFKKVKSDFVELSGPRDADVAIDIPLLSKDVIAMPIDDWLIFEVELHVLVAGGFDEKFSGILTFNPRGKGDIIYPKPCAQTLPGRKDHSLEIEVKWS